MRCGEIATGPARGGDSSRAQRLVLIVSTHVDDLKGAGEEEYRKRLLEGLTSRFGALKTKVGKFECIGVMHEQDEATFEIWTHQQHYVPQIREIPAGKAALLGDDETADEDLKALFMSLVGALAWLVLTMPCICVYVAFLQRQTQSPTMGHIRKANRLLRWVRKHRLRLGIWFRRLSGPLRLVAISDSAFKAEEYKGLVMRGCVILLAEVHGGDASYTHDLGWKSKSTVRCQVLDWYARKHSRVVRSTYAA